MFRLHGRMLGTAALALFSGPAVAEPPPTPAVVPPAAAAPYGATKPYPIDLATALQLADAGNPAVAIARARVREALARQQQANVAWLPDLTAGTVYYRHDGIDQNRRGELFIVSRQNLFLGGGPQMNFNTADALYLPLVARRLTAAAAAESRAVTNNVQLDVALAYLDLLEVSGLLAVNADTLARAEQVLRAAQAGERAGVNKTTADPNRAATEVDLRRAERLNLEARAAAASARLARLLLLEPTVDLLPADPAVVPVILVPPTPSLADLVQTGLRNRPEMAAARAAADAAGVRVRQARMSPLLPQVQAQYLVGSFGGGLNDDLQDFNPRGDFTGQLVWDLRNLGLGNRAQVRERRAQADEAVIHIAEVQAQVGAEVTTAAKEANARYAAMQDAQEAVRQAVEMYRRLAEGSFGMATGRFEALEVLTAVQALNQARVQYLTEVVSFNRAQFRLFTALGQPAALALPGEPKPQPTPAAPTEPPQLPRPRPR